MRIPILLSFAAAIGVGSLALAEANLTGAKCPVVGHQAQEGLHVDYKGGKVYFCCAGCDQTFLADTDKYAAKANRQLFVTGQAKQIACPLSGGPTSEQYAAKIEGATVNFCCGDCQKAVESAANEEEKRRMVFGDKAFAKAFKVGD